MILWDEVIRYFENERVKCERAIKSWGHDINGKPKQDSVSKLESFRQRQSAIDETLRTIANVKFIYDQKKG
jgi:hypothetical protein